MDIKDNWFVASDKEAVEIKKSPNHSGKFRNNLPDTIVLHYTAGASVNSCVNWLCNPAAKASAHLIIGKNGEVVQLVGFDTVAWHAGKSEWKGRKNLNQFSVGIELDNAGLLEKRADGYYTHFNKKIENDQVILATHKNNTTEEAWEAFTPKQLEVVQQICTLLIDKYNIKEIVGHDDIAPQRKVDPGPAFPFNKVVNAILFPNQENSEPKGVVTADLLNIRSANTTDSLPIASPLVKGTKLTVKETKGDWAYVETKLEGWVNTKWISIINS